MGHCIQYCMSKLARFIFRPLLKPFAQGRWLEGMLQLHPARDASEPVDLLASLASLCDKSAKPAERTAARVLGSPIFLKLESTARVKRGFGIPVNASSNS